VPPYILAQSARHPKVQGLSLASTSLISFDSLPTAGDDSSCERLGMRASVRGGKKKKGRGGAKGGQKTTA
jgi:hypothetical protein